MWLSSFFLLFRLEQLLFVLFCFRSPVLASYERTVSVYLVHIHYTSHRAWIIDLDSRSLRNHPWRRNDGVHHIVSGHGEGIDERDREFDPRTEQDAPKGYSVWGDRSGTTDSNPLCCCCCCCYCYCSSSSSSPSSSSLLLFFILLDSLWSIRLIIINIILSSWFHRSLFFLLHFFDRYRYGRSLFLLLFFLLHFIR